MIIQTWNALKGIWSFFAFAASPQLVTRAKLPAFDSPSAVADHLRRHFIYTGDPISGVVDFYTHPEVMEYHFRQGRESTKGLALDCDDLACYAWAALRTIPDCNPILYTLQDGSGRMGHHVVCGYVWKGERGVIDTNGIRRLPNLNPDTLCATFTQVYASVGYRYTAAVPTAYPFG